MATATWRLPLWEEYQAQLDSNFADMANIGRSGRRHHHRRLLPVALYQVVQMGTPRHRGHSLELPAKTKGQPGARYPCSPNFCCGAARSKCSAIDSRTMTQVDFYILDSNAGGDRYHLACRIAEKARRAGHRVLIHTPIAEESRHSTAFSGRCGNRASYRMACWAKTNAQINPILIGDGSSDTEEHEVLINLAPEVPMFFSRFERLIECVDHDDGVKAAGRERFRFYREHGYPLKTHKIA